MRINYSQIKPQRLTINSFWTLLFHFPQTTNSLYASGVLEIIVTDRKLSIANLSIIPFHNTNVTTSKNWSFLLITRYCQLRQVQNEFLPQTHRKYKRTHVFVSRPMLFRWVPSQSSIPANYFSKLILDKNKRIWGVVAFLMEFLSAKTIFTGSENQVKLFYFSVWWK